jgi:hypothetical protein
MNHHCTVGLHPIQSPAARAYISPAARTLPKYSIGDQGQVHLVDKAPVILKRSFCGR